MTDNRDPRMLDPSSEEPQEEELVNEEDIQDDEFDEPQEEDQADESEDGGDSDKPEESKSAEKKSEKKKPKVDENKVYYKTTCIHCNRELSVGIPRDPLAMAYDLQAMGVYPVDNIFVYQVTKQQIEDFLFEKAKRYVPGLRSLMVRPIFTKSGKKSKSAEPGHSYAALHVIMSAEAIADELKKYGFFGKLGMDDDRVKVRKDLYNLFVQRYSYDRKIIEQDLKSYKQLEKYENQFGMTEEYLMTLRNYSIPRQVKDADDNAYVIFAANPIKIFNDMFITAHDKKQAGRIMKLVDTTQVDGDSGVVYTIHIHTNGVGSEKPSDDLVKAMLRGDTKGK